MLFTATATAQVGPLSRSDDPARQIGTPADSVAGRARPGYEPIGFRLGSFLAVPSLSLLGGYDTNLYNREVPKVADAFASIRPRVAVTSTWSQHRLAVIADANVQRFADRTSENSEQFGISAAGQLDVRRDFRISTQTIAARRIEPRGSSGDVFIGQEPVSYDELTGATAAAKDFGRLQTRLGMRASRFSYNDVRLDGVRTSLAFRDYRVAAVNGGIGYQVGPALQVTLDANANRSYFPNRATGPSRDSNGYSVLGGFAFAPSRLLVAEASIGYLRQSYENPLFPDIGGLAYDARLAWNPTPLISLTAQAARDIQRGPTIGVAGITQDNVQVGADYELLRNLILGAGVDYTRWDFNGIDRVDHRLAGRLSARYLMNRTLSFTLTMNARRQRSAGNMGRDYDGAGVLAGMTIQR
jgi:hypothetical protein